jgi:hypothetical protein
MIQLKFEFKHHLQNSSAANGNDYFFFICAVELRVLQPLTGLLYQPRMIGDGDCGEIGGMKIGRGNRNTWRKPAPVPLCPPQITVTIY